MKYHSTLFFKYIYNMYAYELAYRLGHVYKNNKNEIAVSGMAAQLDLIPADPNYRLPELQKIREDFNLEITYVNRGQGTEDTGWTISYGNWQILLNGVEDDNKICTLFNELSVKFNVEEIWSSFDGGYADEFIGIADFKKDNMGFPFLGVVRRYYTSYEDSPKQDGTGIVITRSKICAGFIMGSVRSVINSSLFDFQGSVGEFEKAYSVHIQRLTFSEACKKLMHYYRKKHPEDAEGMVTYKWGSHEFKERSFYKQIADVFESRSI